MILTAIRHGTLTAYDKAGCRCERCRAIKAESRRLQRAAYLAVPVPCWAPHGSASTYENYACRCERCRAAKSAVDALRRPWRHTGRRHGGTT